MIFLSKQTPYQNIVVLPFEKNFIYFFQKNSNSFFWQHPLQQVKTNTSGLVTKAFALVVTLQPNQVRVARGCSTRPQPTAPEPSRREYADNVTQSGKDFLGTTVRGRLRFAPSKKLRTWPTLDLTRHKATTALYPAIPQKTSVHQKTCAQLFWVPLAHARTALAQQLLQLGKQSAAQLDSSKRRKKRLSPGEDWLITPRAPLTAAHELRAGER